MKKLILAVIDGLTPSMLESSLDRRALPTLSELAGHGSYCRAVSVFPSLTPVCLSSIVTGTFPDAHGIPHLVWWHRDEQRLVEYGSSFGAVRAAGVVQTLSDTMLGLSRDHLSADTLTLFESLADAGLQTAAVNYTAYRGRTRHRSPIPLIGDVLGPELFFFYNVFDARKTGAPLSWRNRPAGSIDAYATAVGRWLVTRDAFDFFLFYLSDYDYASHALGPDSAHDVLLRCDQALGELVTAAGGMDAFLDRYAIVVMADHGQSAVADTVDLRHTLSGIAGARVTASNRAGMVYAERGAIEAVVNALVRERGVDVALHLDEDWAVAHRREGRVAFRPLTGGAFELEGDLELEHPDALRRAWHALHGPHAGEVLVSAAEGWELADLGGRHHAGGGSHGSLAEADSLVPVLSVGTEVDVASITDVAPAIRQHFGRVPIMRR
ncbi:MAG: alkaline phosphatase family protein [Gaiella sp.]